MSNSTTPQKPVQWKHLEPNPRSHYKQLFLKGRRIRAEIIYGHTVDGSEPSSAEEVAADFGLPLDAVLEAIAYCEANPQVIEQDHRGEEARIKLREANVARPGFSSTNEEPIIHQP